MDQQNVNFSMDSFSDNMNSILDTYNKYKLNKYKLMFKTKFWVTLALQKSVSIINNCKTCKRSSSKRKIL